MDIETLKSIFIVTILGFLIGLERNISFKEENVTSFAGSRTFSIIALSGYLSGYLSKFENMFIYFGFASISLLISLAYFVKIFKYKKEGSTTHFSAIVTFFIGLLIFYNQKLFAITITILLIALLNLKSLFKRVENTLSKEDINSAILLLGMTFLILPYLPDKMIYYINPYKTWLMAIIISSLSFLGYIAIKLIGEKYGILITGAAGGFVSSTAVSYSLSKMFANIKNKTSLFTYASAIAIANTIMFARILVEAFLINQNLITYLSIPFLITTIMGIYISYRFYKKSPSQKVNTSFIINKNPLSLDEALKFAIIFAIIYGAIHFIGDRFGSIGIYIISLISGLTDVDAITLSLSSLSKSQIPLKTAAIGITIAAVSNSIFKLSLVWIFGTKELAKEITKFFLILFLTLLLSLLVTLFIL